MDDAATATRVPDRPGAMRQPSGPSAPSSGSSASPSAASSASTSSRPFAPRNERAAAASLLDLVQSLLHELPGLISDRVELLSLELARAGAALGKIAALTVAVAILGITAWAALWVGVVMGLLALDWHWAVALGIVILANAAAAAWALLQMRRLAGLLKLPATRRHLTMRASAQAVAAQSLPVATGAGADDSLEEDEHHASRRDAAVRR